MINIFEIHGQSNKCIYLERKRFVTRNSITIIMHYNFNCFAKIQVLDDVIYCLCRSLGGGGLEGSTSQLERVMRWRDGKRVVGAVPGAFCFGVPPHRRIGKWGGGGICKRTGWTPILTRKCGGPHRLPTEDGSR